MSSAKKKPRELLDKYFRELVWLTEEMEITAVTVLDQLSEDVKYTQTDLAALEGARDEALKLAHNCQAAIQVFEERWK